MSDLIEKITSDLQNQIVAYQPEYSVQEVGSVVEAGDGIA